jgi:methylmalonyl-CoA mutase
MADAAPPSPSFASLPLRLAEVFPPVPAEAWRAAIARDLGDADPASLDWDAGDGLRLRPYYRREDLAGLDTTPLTHRRCTWRTPGTVDGLAIRVGAGAEGLRAAAGLARDRRGHPVTLVVEPGPILFLEIARLRALRRLCGDHAGALTIHADVRADAASADTVGVGHALIRATIAASGAILGGADTITIGGDGLDPVLAEHVFRILDEEAGLTEAIDPAGGAYLVEVLTDRLVAAATNTKTPPGAGGPRGHEADLDHLDYAAGLPPFLRGPYSTMYLRQPWTIRQ